MQLKRATDILLRIFVYLASHLAVQQGYLKAVRGRTGGVSLAKPAREYRVGDIVRLTEVNEELVECDEPRCPLLNGGCRLRGVLFNAREAFYKELDGVTLDQIAVFPMDKIATIRVVSD